MPDVLSVELEALALYGYCPLLYRYRHVFGLPYTERSAQSAYAECVRGAISRLLYELPRRGPERAKGGAVKQFTVDWEKAQTAGGWGTETTTGLSLEGHLALLDLFQRIDSDDTVMGGMFDTEVSIGSDLVIKGRLDGLIMKKDTSQYRTVCIIHVSNERSPLWSPRYQPLQFQWAMAVVRRQLKYHRGDVAHWVFSPWTTQAPKLKDAAVNRAEFSAAAKSLAHGIRSEVYFQTPHSSRCKVCHYQGICTAQHTGKVTTKEIERLRRTT